MLDDLYYVRKDILNFNRNIIKNYYINEKNNMLYKEKSIELINEALNCFWFGSPRASIILSGEAIQRILISFILNNVQEGTEIKYGKEGIKKLKHERLIDDDDYGYTFYEIIEFFLKDRKVANELKKIAHNEKSKK